MRIPKKVEQRLIDGIKKYQPIISTLHDRDINEADTVTLITDILNELFGFDKYTDVTREHCIRGTYVDLAIAFSGKLQTLIEVKAIGIALNENHLRQAINYGANEGVEWAILTNGIEWQVHKIAFTKPISHEMVFNIKFSELNHKNNCDIESLFLLTKEAMSKSALDDYHLQKQATDKFLISAIILDDSILSAIRRELRRVSPTVQIQIDEIKETLTHEVLKRELVGGEKFQEATKKIIKAAKKTLRTSSKEDKAEETIQEDNNDSDTGNNKIINLDAMEQM